MRLLFNRGVQDEELIIFSVRDFIHFDYKKSYKYMCVEYIYKVNNRKVDLKLKFVRF